MTHPKSNAFPLAFKETDNTIDGMTKLEYFAAAAMQGFIASYAIPDVGNPQADIVAKYAVAYAKALVEELNK
jgi:hypothetical protein